MIKLESKKIKSVCMLSTHGYFDPVPELGKTDTGGQVLYVLQLARALTKAGIKVDIYTRWFDKERKQIDPLPGCPDARVIRIPAGPWEFIPKEFIYDVLDELSENMVNFIKKEGLDYDLYHGHYVDAGIVTLKVAEAFQKSSFFTSHSLGAWKRQRTEGNPGEMDKVFNFTHRIAEELRVFKSITAQTVTSTEELGKIEELYNFKPPRVKFTPPGVDVYKFAPLKEGEKEEKTAVSLPDKYVFMVSRIGKAKGHDLLLPAFASVHKEFPHVHLVIGGGAKNPDEEEIEVFARAKEFVKENNLADYVHMVGGLPHDDLPPYFRQSEVFILPARYEPFGMTALEAMSCEVPAVISRFAGVQENLSSGEDCLIADPFDTEGFAGAIRSVLRNKDFKEKLSRKGRETVLKTFSWEAIAGRFLEVYEKYV